jgi:Zn-dependent protease with chaperone function
LQFRNHYLTFKIILITLNLLLIDTHKLTSNLIPKALILMFLNICLGVNAQQVDLTQFYTSRFEPTELNINSEERVKLLYQEYIERYDDKSKVDEKQFVYEYNYYLDRLNRSGNIFYGDSIGKYLNELKDFIIEDENLRKTTHVYLTNFPYLNAFTNDFGNIYVNVATIALIDSEEELMYMLAHEIGHVILRHSYKTKEIEESNKRKWNNNDEQANFERHAFSREHELQADSLAFALLKDKIPAEYALKLMDKLSTSSNPVYPGPIDFALLTGNNIPSKDFLDTMWNKSLSDTVYFLVDDNDSLSTHPSSEARKISLGKLSEGYSSEGILYQASGKFAEAQNLARYLLLDSYLENGMNLEAVDLAVKMRIRGGDEKFLIARQIKAMAAMIQAKHYGGTYDQILNEGGNACSDEDYLRLRKLVLGMSPMDFNLLMYQSLNTLIDSETNSFSTELALKKSYQFLYKSYPSLFIEDSLNHTWKYGEWEGTLSNVLEEEEPEEQNDKGGKKEKKSIKLSTPMQELTDLGYVFISSADTSYLINGFLDTLVINDTLANYLSEYKKSLEDSTFSVSPYEMFDVLSVPHRTISYFHRGRFLKSSKFDLEGNTALIESDNWYFDSKKRRNYQLNFEKSLELETMMTEIQEGYPKYNHDFSNRTNTESKDGISVYDNYLHRIIQNWMDDISLGEDLIYSPMDDLIHEYVYAQGISYLVYRICVVTKNKGAGKKNIINYYEIYFDIENDGVAYVSKIASKLPPNKFQLEQMIYLSSENKKLKD